MAVAGFQGFFTGFQVAPGEAADKVPVLSAKEDQWGGDGRLKGPDSPQAVCRVGVRRRHLDIVTHVKKDSDEL